MGVQFMVIQRSKIIWLWKPPSLYHSHLYQKIFPLLFRFLLFLLDLPQIYVYVFLLFYFFDKFSKLESFCLFYIVFIILNKCNFFTTPHGSTHYSFTILRNKNYIIFVFWFFLIPSRIYFLRCRIHYTLKVSHLSTHSCLNILSKNYLETIANP